MFILFLYNDCSIEIVTRSQTNTIKQPPHLMVFLSVSVFAPWVAEEDLFTPLGGPLMTNPGILEVETPNKGTPRTKTPPIPEARKHKAHPRTTNPKISMSLSKDMPINKRQTFRITIHTNTDIQHKEHLTKKRKPELILNSQH